MQEKLLKITTVILAVTVLAAGAAFWHYSSIHAREREKAMSGLERLNFYTARAKEEDTSFDQRLRIELPEGMQLADIGVEQNYVKQLVTVTIPNVKEDYFQDHPLLGKSSHIDDLYMEKGVIEITMDAVYEVKTNLEQGYLYLDFVPPKEIYDKVIVIDAGHGGKAAGATKKGIMEKDLNLGIALKLKALLEQNGQNLGIYYTRTEDKNPTFEQRAQLANKSGADLFISIHNNSTADGTMSDYNGTEVMYDDQKSEEGLSSKHLAELCLEEVTNILGSKNNGLTKGNSIYIIRNSQVPVALIEVGFMTNQRELEQLNSEEYQQLAAQGICNAIQRALAEGY